MLYFIFINFLIFILVTIAMLILDDLLLRYQYKNYKDNWIADGRPRGFIFSPDDSSLVAYWKQSFQHLEKRLLWANNDVKTKTLYKLMLILKRVLVCYSILFVPVVFVVLIIN